MVPIFEQVSTSENSNFIILAFDVIQNNPRIKTHIQLNETKTKMESVTLTLTDLHNLRVKFTFEGRTLIANANELVNAIRYHIISKRDNPNISKFTKSARSSLTEFLDRMITGHLTQHPEEANNLLQDPAVIDINYFGRNPDMIPNNPATRLHNHMPITPAKVGSRVGSGVVSSQRVGSGAAGSKAGSTWREVGSVTKAATTEASEKSEDEDYITVETSKITTPMTKRGGHKEAQVSRGFIELRDTGRPIRINIDDFKWFTYWI